MDLKRAVYSFNNKLILNISVYPDCDCFMQGGVWPRSGRGHGRVVSGCGHAWHSQVDSVRARALVM